VTMLVVTGTDTGVGKTVTTAAIAAAATASGMRVAVLKPGQTGIRPGSGEESDAQAVARLAAPATTRTLASYPDPLAPLAAAQESGLEPLVIGDVIEAATDADAAHDLVIVEGAGGLLVPLGEHWTVADLAMALRAPVVVVARADLGTLNHTALTLEALSRRLLPASVVIGSWPRAPELVHWRNLVDLPGELAGVLPEGAGGWPGETFRAAAPLWLTARLYGVADPDRLRADGVPVD
jgi:dethiobiotin synthetase